jgi:hypothetical protein
MSKNNMNNKKRTFILEILINCGILLMLSHTASSQTISFEKKSVIQILLYEKSQMSILSDVIESWAGKEFPSINSEVMYSTIRLKYDRLYDDFDPKLHVEYDFDNITEELYVVRYIWGFESFNPSEDLERFEKYRKSENEFMNKFFNFKKEFIKKFGNPIIDKTYEDKDYGYNEDSEWEDKEKSIVLIIDFDRKIDKIGTGGNGFQYVSVKVSFK